MKTVLFSPRLSKAEVTAQKEFKMKNRRISAFGVVLIALLSLGGCDNVSESNGMGKKDENGANTSLLSGKWVLNSQETQYLVFGDSGKFTIISVDNDTATFPGKYTILDSMIHTTIYQNGVPEEEVWLRFKYMKDSIVLYKGVLLNGSSLKLIGKWGVESTVMDSLGQLYLYQYEFLANGLVVKIGPSYVDTSAYSYSDSTVTFFDKSNGKFEMNMGYEIQSGRLSLYNLGTEKTYYRVR